MISLKYVSATTADYYIVTLGFSLNFEPGETSSDPFLRPGFELDSIISGASSGLTDPLVILRIECKAGKITTTVDWEAINIMATAAPQVLGEIRAHLRDAGHDLKHFDPRGGSA